MANWRARGRRKRAGTAFCLSHGSVCTLEDLAGERRRAALDAGLHLQGSRLHPRIDASAPQKSNYDALVLTIDNQMLGNRERDIRNGFAIPPRFSAMQLAGMALEGAVAVAHAPGIPAHHLRQLCAARRARRPQGAGRAHGLAARSRRCHGTTSTDLRKQWQGPLILKGVLHPDRGADARSITASTGSSSPIMAAGSSTARPPAIDALPGVVAAVDGRIPVLVDGGIRRGGDMVKSARARRHPPASIGAAAIVGPGGRRRGGRQRMCSTSIAAKSTGPWACAAQHRHRRDRQTSPLPATRTQIVIKDPPLLTIRARFSAARRRAARRTRPAYRPAMRSMPWTGAARSTIASSHWRR